MTSTAYLSIEFLIQEQFNTSTQVTALGQSLFIIGTAVGPLCLGPLSYSPLPLPQKLITPVTFPVVAGSMPALACYSPFSILAARSRLILPK